VVSDDVDRVQRRFEAMSPFLEGCEDGEELFVVSVVVQLCSNKSSTVKCYWMDITVVCS
jgi:hypothetical protein